LETLEQLRRQLDTFDDLSAVVRTMKALAAVSVRQYEQAVRSLTDYYRTVELGLHVVLREMPPVAPAPIRRAPEKTGAVIFGSDHGLCGRFNEDMADHAASRLAELTAGGEPARLIAVGARVAALVESDRQPLEETMFVPGSAERITATVRQILFKIDEWQTQDRVQRVYLFHNQPTSGGRYRPSGAQLLPVDLKRFHRLEAARWPGRSLPTYRIERGRLLSALLRQYFFVSIFRACAESLAAENASRLSAMQSADRSLGERHEELRGEFRRQRQDAITAELLDVVSGYEVLNAEPPAT
jgi:F-type H+-transporting ATPase subunit gamma